MRSKPGLADARGWAISFSSHRASDINNGGFDSQVRFLIETESPCSTPVKNALAHLLDSPEAELDAADVAALRPKLAEIVAKYGP